MRSEREWIEWMRRRMHHYVIVNLRKMGFNGAASPPAAASVIYLSLSLHPFLSLRFTLSTINLFPITLCLSTNLS